MRICGADFTTPNAVTLALLMPRRRVSIWKALLSLNPVANCALSLGSSVLGSIADCGIDPDGCGRSALINGATGVLGCIPGAGGSSITAEERMDLMTIALPSAISLDDREAFIDRIEGIASGALSPEQWGAEAMATAASDLMDWSMRVEEKGWDTIWDGFLIALSSNYPDYLRGEYPVLGGGKSSKQQAGEERIAQIAPLEVPFFYRLTERLTFSTPNPHSTYPSWRI